MTRRLHVTVLGLAAAVTMLGGCERSFRDMYDQSRYKPLAGSPLWSDGRASRPPVDGAVARSEGTFAGTTSGRAGVISRAPIVPPLAAIRDELRPGGSTGSAKGPETQAAPRDAAPATLRRSDGAGERDGAEAAPDERPATFAMPPITAELLARGRDRFDIFCAPCHSIAGDGDGFIARRGFPHPPSYHVDRLRNAGDAHLYAVITDGYGAMYPYARRLVPADRLAVVAYIRALQLSQHAPLDAVPGDVRARLEAQR
jgi:mono/diheme cytochrome c family protein